MAPPHLYKTQLSCRIPRLDEVCGDEKVEATGEVGVDHLVGALVGTRQPLGS